VTVELERNPFAVSWWPVDVALAWIITRDRTFVERHWTRRGSKLAVTISLAVDSHSGQQLPRYVDGVEAAWTELKGLLEDGKIRVVASPFRRTADFSAGAVETSESQQEIPDSEIGSLTLTEDGDDLCLIPEDWRVARGSNWNNLRGYRNPLVRANGVLHFFQPSSTALPSEYLGKPATPHSPGVMSISQSAYWIASAGGNSPFNLREELRWKTALEDLLPLICSGSISVIGRRHGRGLAVAIDAVRFAGIAIDYPYSPTPVELAFCERPHLRCFGVVDGDIWEKQCNDQLMGNDRHVPEYSHLQIINADLARHFPFNETSAIKAGQPSLRSAIRDVAKELWPDGKWPARIKERDPLIQAKFTTPPSARTIRRALSEKL
jgi:hypothetical protein